MITNETSNVIKLTNTKLSHSHYTDKWESTAQQPTQRITGHFGSIHPIVNPSTLSIQELYKQILTSD